MTTNAEQREDLAVRIERRIFAAMEPDPDTRIGMTLFAATCKVAEDVRAEARAKGWEPHLVRAVGIFAVKVGGAIGRRAIERGIVTREQLLPGSPVTDVVTLPEPTDIQVATAWPQVQAYRAAAITAGKAAYAAEVQHRYLDDTRRRIPDDTPTHRKIRQEAYLRYRAAADEHDKALNAMAAAETAAQEVAPAATRRAQLTQDAYSARLHGERQADLQRRGLDE